MRELNPHVLRQIRRRSLTVVAAVAVFGLSFGVLAAQSGLSLLKTSALSVLVFAGGSQFAAVGLAAAGNATAGVVAGLLLNSRLAAFGVLAAPLVSGSWWRRLVGAQLVTDEATSLAMEHEDRDLSRYAFWFSGVALFVVWNAVTILGATVGDVLGDRGTEGIGLDAAFPAVFIALLAPRLRAPASRRTAIGAVVVAIGLTPLLPAGVPVLAAGAAVVLGLRPVVR